MKKHFKVFSIILILCLSVSVFAFLTACGDEAKGKTVEQVTTAFEEAGYQVSSETMSGISATVAIKETDSIVILYFDSEKLAKEQKTVWEESAKLLGQTCKQDVTNIYYGTAAAIAVYEGIQ